MTAIPANHSTSDSRPPSRFRPWRHTPTEEHQSHAEQWFRTAITTWETDGRLSPTEAERLHARMNEPQFLAVLPHFGVHLAIGAVLRFPIGSIMRFIYVLMNITVATLRLLTRGIDRRAWRQAMHVHTPLVLLISCMPGVGTFAYLASPALRSNPLLLRVGIDAVLVKVPLRLYERSGLRWVLARPQRIATHPFAVSEPPLRMTFWVQNIVLVMGLTLGALFAADILTQSIAATDVIDADAMGIRQALRMFDLNGETSFATWYQVTSLTFLAVLLACVGLARQHLGAAYAKHWFALGLLALGFSLDEQVKLHDPGGGTAQIRESLGLSGPLFYGWVLIGSLSVLIVTIIYRRFVLELPQVTRRLYVLAAALFVAGEIGVESLTGWYANVSGSETDLMYQTLTSFEELFGMLGIFVAIAATLHYAQVHFGEILISLHDRVPAEQVSVQAQVQAQSSPVAPRDDGIQSVVSILTADSGPRAAEQHHAYTGHTTYDSSS